MNDNNKKLYRVEDGKIIAGVCAGIAEYFNIDATIVRIGWVLLSFWGVGLLAYIVALIVMPQK
ncbi:MAG: PspC domain-containing protein [Clostridia bacterium]|nr:PspC domain-containing protein [Clostridia bacterium]